MAIAQRQQVEAPDKETPVFRNKQTYRRVPPLRKILHPVMALPGRLLWQLPGRFDIARLLHPRYSLRCVLFHDIADAPSAYKDNMNVSVTSREFESALRFLTKHYTPVSLQEVLNDSGRGSPERRVLLTFDDAYASIREIAAPLCRQYGVPFIFFVNAESVGNRCLALDNLICYVVNTSGMRAVNEAVQAVCKGWNTTLRSMSEVFNAFLPAISLLDRVAFRRSLTAIAGIDEAALARNAQLYLTEQQLGEIQEFGGELGNHTYSHVHCRALTREDFDREIDQNRRILESISGKRVRSFSVPYGSSHDLSSDLSSHLRLAGYEAAFLVERCANSSASDTFLLDRVSIQKGTAASWFSEIEILPRIRSLTKRLLEDGRGK